MTTRCELAFLIALSLGMCGCGEPPPPGPAPVEPPAYFTDVTATWGVAFRHQEGTTLRTLPQVTGAGVALLDYDGDGLLDLFLVQGAGPADRTGPAGTGALATVPGSRLFRNTGAGFEDVTAAAGAEVRGSGMAVLALDFDNDGRPDLAVTFYGRPMELLHNDGDGTFSRRAAAAGLESRGTIWESCLAALDYDRDGFLDLFRGQYLAFAEAEWRAAPEVVDGAGSDLATLSSLLAGRYAGLPATLYHARGDGTFEDRTGADGVGGAPVAALGALAGDLDGDGWPELVVAADGHTRNRVLHNARGRFVDVSRASYADEQRGAMGLALSLAGADAALAITHWENPPALYRVQARAGGLAFSDRAEPAGLGAGPRGIGWGVGFVDVDQDGREDLLELRGGSAPPASQPWSGHLEREPARLWLAQPDGRYSLVGPEDPLARRRVGRGAAFGDLDRDGAVDVVVTANNGPAEIWRAAPPRAGWIALDAVGTDSSRDPVGLSLELAGRPGARRQLTSGDSYFSSSDRGAVFGLGGDARPVTVRARWPRGRREEFGPLAPRRRHRLVEGAGRDIR